MAATRYESWWRHQVETFSLLLAICVGNSPATGEFPAQRSVTRSFEVFFDLRLNKHLSKQSGGWWFETPSRPLWRHCIEDTNHVIRFIWHLSDLSHRGVSIWWLMMAYLVKGDLRTSSSGTGPLFTKRTDSRHTARFREASKPRNWMLYFDRRLCSAGAEVPVKFQSDWKSLNLNSVASRRHEILR